MSLLLDIIPVKNIANLFKMRFNIISSAVIAIVSMIVANGQQFSMQRQASFPSQQKQNEFCAPRTIPNGFDFNRCTRPGLVALTFDDGPDNLTGALLDILAAQKARATFFVVGKQLEQQSNANLLTRAFNDGHQIATHSYTHADFAKIPLSSVKSEMSKVDNKIRQILGFAPTYTRYPFGSSNAQVFSLTKQRGVKVANWNLDTKDYETPRADDVFKKIDGPVSKESPKNASFIVLQHTFAKSTLDSMERVIKMFRTRGYRFVTFAECVGDYSVPYRV